MLCTNVISICLIRYRKHPRVCVSLKSNRGASYIVEHYPSCGMSQPLDLNFGIQLMPLPRVKSHLSQAEHIWASIGVDSMPHLRSVIILIWLVSFSTGSCRLGGECLDLFPTVPASQTSCKGCRTRSRHGFPGKLCNSHSCNLRMVLIQTHT